MENPMTTKKSDEALDVTIEINNGQINFHMSLRLIRLVLITLTLGVTIMLTLLTVRDPKTWVEVLQSFLSLTHLILGLIDENSGGINRHNPE
jgi:hypothetical protein